MSIFDLLDEKITPKLKKYDRLMGVIFYCGVIRRDQLETITNWPESELRGALDMIRRHDEPRHIPRTDPLTAEERQKLKSKRDAWLKIFRYEERGKNCYTLGGKGVAYVCKMLGETKRQPLSGGEAVHMVGINEVLCRLLRAGLQPKSWFGTKEASSWVWRKLRPRKITFDYANQEYEVSVKRPDFVVMPDAMLEIEEGRLFFIEFDRGHQHGEVLKDKFHGYFQLKAKLKQVPPVVWVTVSERRKNQLIQAWEDAKQTYLIEQEYAASDFEFPDCYVFLEGEEVDFFLNYKAKPETAAALVDGTEELRAEIEQLRAERDQLRHVIQRQKAEQQRLTDLVDTLEQEKIQWKKRNTEIERQYSELIGWIHQADQEMSKSMMSKRNWASFKENNPIPEISSQ